MMNIGIPKIGQRLAAWLLLAAVGVALEFGAVRPVIDLHHELDAKTARAEALIVRLSGVFAQAGDYQAALAELRRREAASELYITGATVSVAAAELQTRLSTQIRAAGGAIQSLQALPAGDVQAFRRILVRVQFTASTSTFPAILHRLESAQPLLFVDHIEISMRPQPPRSGGEPLPEAVLTVRMDLGGFMRPEA